MFKPNLRLLLFCIIALTQLSLVKACLNYDEQTQRCSLCPFGTHLHKGNCLYDLPQCLQYERGTDCKLCIKGYKLVNRVDRVECKKLQVETKDQYASEQIDPTLSQGSADKIRLNFYSFLNGYLIQKYREQQVECQLVKVIDRLYKNGQNQVIMMYRTSEVTVEKTTVGVISNYKSFQLKQTVETSPEDIGEDQIVILDSAKLLAKVIKPQSDEISKSTSKSSSRQQNLPESKQQKKQTSDFNYEYQKPQARQEDIGFKTSNELIRLGNAKVLNDEAKVVGCFVKKSSGLRRHYRIFYKTGSEEMYEGEVIYDIVRRKAYILNFGKQFSV